MVRLSKKTLFAIEAVLDIAYHAGAQPVSSQDITGRQNIQRRYLEQVLQQLVRAGILAGMRGPRGGYRLACDRRRVTVGQIIRIIRESEGTADPINDPCGSPLSHAVVRPLCQEIQVDVDARLDRISIEDLCHRAHACGIDECCAPPVKLSIKG